MNRRVQVAPTNISKVRYQIPMMIPTPEAPDSAFELLCGEEFARGQHRTVHFVIGHPDLVMKVDSNTTFANWNEYLVSSSLDGRAEPVAKLMGCVKAISATGKYLIMERLDDIQRKLVGIQYPVWLNDGFKPSAYGVTPSGEVKVRDFGTLKLAGVLAKLRYFSDRPPMKKIVELGADQDYAKLQGVQIGTDAGRSVHKVNGSPNHILKVCPDSHRANRVELLVHSALLDMNADELDYFGALECSRSGKYLIMERLPDLPAGFAGQRPPFPWWLAEQSDACLGVTPEGTARIRSYSAIKLGDVLAYPALRTFS
jgi:hypothetical protein